ncbi:divalent-cation tolerance protein CutA [Pontixanthobacter aestiaquae]|uniref:Divalent cation tolerance protein CutA n=1 Tax=Pontixanthobacter aestiaquae TaxID=1509367 RepID=A0A844Z364_9SPHN|nr:divalent-cation tolerance protein CutA [Pontixanthobacter aestiaquae]MDN3646860.1 divalent-cation tolerance protein CutA [Pontixanthobacter aestiaquae]MXO82158.1 divalent cation tolerance protein CutA [Pontixanthobacter aestiaquae]
MSALIWTVFRDEGQARPVVAILLHEKLVACANLSVEIQSIFLWRDNIDEQHECGVLLKTHQSLLKDAIERLESLHPYETPAILGWQCSEVGVATDAWLSELVEPGGNGG